jgi:hypothetical protein
MLKNILLFFSSFLLFSSCELASLIDQGRLQGTWKIHYRYEGEQEGVMPVTFTSDHGFTYPVDDEKGSGVWTIKENKVELEFTDRMIWKGILNEGKTEIKKGIMINSGYGSGGSTWDGKKIE